MIRRLVRRRYPVVTPEALRTYPEQDLRRRLEWPHRPPSLLRRIWNWILGVSTHNQQTCARCLVVDELARRRCVP